MMSRQAVRKPLPESTIRRTAIEMFRGLDISPSADIEDICERLGEVRNRPVRLMPRSFPDTSAFGLWLKTDSSDIIVYERDATPDHRRHIIRHEIGHVLFDHESEPRSDDEAIRALVPTLPLSVVQNALRRSCYETAAEWEAEVFASVMSDLAGHSSRPRNSAAPGNWLEEAFDSGHEWR